jgi:hypothetical protein
MLGSERLTEKSVPTLSSIDRKVTTMRPDFPQIMASVAVQSPSSPAFDHEIATGIRFLAALAAASAWEEDRALQKTTWR